MIGNHNFIYRPFFVTFYMYSLNICFTSSWYSSFNQFKYCFNNSLANFGLFFKLWIRTSWLFTNSLFSLSYKASNKDSVLFLWRLPQVEIKSNSLKSWQLGVGLAVNAEKTLSVVDFEMGWVNWKQENSRLKSMTLIRAFWFI